jgi:hypothetical protein
MTWRKFLTALSIAVLFGGIYGAVGPALASVNQAALVTKLNSDQSMVNALVVQVGQMTNLDGKRAPLIADLSAISNSLGTLKAKTLSDTSSTALGGDATRFSSLDSELRSFEAPKIRLAGRANAELAELSGLLGGIQASGGLVPTSPAHSKTVGLMNQLLTARSQLDQAVAGLDGATLVNYPGSRSWLSTARSLLDAAAATLVTVDRLAVQLPLPGASRARNEMRLWIITESLLLNQLRDRVKIDPNLTTKERNNLITQIDADLTAFGTVSKTILTGTGKATIGAELIALMNEKGAFILIVPKADIMLGAAADRSAINGLTSLIPTLQSHIAAVGAGHHDVTSLNLLLTDLTTQLAGASADIAPIDAELEAMTAMTATQLSHDGHVMLVALTALKDAQSRLSTASNDANVILAAAA